MFSADCPSRAVPAFTLALAMCAACVAFAAPPAPAAFAAPPAVSGPPAAASPELELSSSQLRALGVETASARARKTLELAGLPAEVVVPNAQMRVVAAPLAGLVEQVLVSAPQQVRRGQPLLRLQSPALADLQHTFLQATTQLQLAQTQRTRDDTLLTEGLVSESRAQATRARQVEAQASLAERTQQLRLAGLPEDAIEGLRAGRRIDSALVVVSPIDGTVLELMALAGQRVEVATALLKVARLDPLWIEIQVPATRAAGVREGAAVSVLSPPATGRVIVVGRRVSPSNQTVLVRALATEGSQRLMPGQSVQVAVEVDAPGGQWQVPVAALSREGPAASVFVRTAGGFRRQPVTVVAEGAQYGIVAGPLTVGDAIAVRGVAALVAAFAAGVVR